MTELWYPTLYTPPLSEEFPTDGDTLIPFVEMAWTTPEQKEGFKLLEWQKWLLRHVLERYPDDYPDTELAGKLRYRQVVVSVGRQNGKSVIGAILGLYGLLLHDPGPTVIGIASSVDQAQIIYRRTLLVINSHAALKKRFAKTTETRGIATSDGRGVYQLKAAKDSALQGIPVSLCLFDELHISKPEMWSAMVLGTSQRENGMVFGITTAGDEDSALLKDLYETGKRAVQGQEGLERFGFFLWEAPAGSDIKDPDAINAANPTVAEGHLSIKTVLSDIESIPEVDARRYRLNQFVASRADTWIPVSMWNACATTQRMPEGRCVFAIDRTPGWEYASITAAVKTEDSIYTEVVASLIKPTKDSLLQVCLELAKLNPVCFVAEGFMLKDLISDLQDRGLRAKALSTTEVCQASSTAYALAAQQRLKHHNDQIVNVQVPHGIRRQKGEAWRISRVDSTQDIDALMATVMGIYEASREEDLGPQMF